MIKPYWPIELNGKGSLLRKFTGFPTFFPLCVYSNHGAFVGIDDIPSHELDSDAPYQLYMSDRHVAKWKTISNKPVFQYKSPFVEYRQRYVTKPNNPRGTVAFPLHSTPSINDDLNWNLYGKELLTLPKDFHPITACVHMHDIRKGKHLELEEVGITVVTAGDTLDSDFPYRFYDIIKNAKYITSNGIGSYTFYGIEMNIPFFIFGPEQKWLNYKDKNIPFGEYNPRKLFQNYTYALNLFTYNNLSDIKITKEQECLLKEELGINNGLPWYEIRKILYKALIIWIFSNRSIKYVQNRLKKKVISKNKNV